MLFDPQDVSRLIRETAEAEVLPRWRRLGETDVREKAPGDLVTTADLESERRLSAALPLLVPGSVVVGEEACERDPELIRHVASDRPCWVVDPVDGTRNFAEGSEHFALIVAFCQGGACRAGWILAPVSGTLVWAVEDDGAYIGSDTRLRLGPRPATLEEMRGSLGWKHLRKIRQRRKRGETGPDLPRDLVRRGCTGLDYLELARGRLHFAHYKRLKPWDHVAGALIHREAGGYNALTDAAAPGGRPYRLEGEVMDTALLSAPDRETWDVLLNVVEE